MQSPFNAFSKGIVEYGQETEYSASAFFACLKYHQTDEKITKTYN